MWGSLDGSMPESWPEDPAAKAWKDAEAAAALQAQAAVAPARTWGDTWNDIKTHLSPGVPATAFGSLSPVAPNDDPSVVAAARMRASVKPVSGRAEGPITKLTENIVPALAEGVASGVTAPGDAMSGKLPMYGPEGNTSLEAVRRGFDTASLAGGGAVGGAASRAVPQLAADAAKAGAPIAAAAHAAPAAPFYSALDQTVGAAKMTRAPGAQWEATLRNAGVKPEELDYRGVTPLLKERAGQPITKEELTAHLQANPVPEIKPVDRGTPAWDKLTPDQQWEVQEAWKEQGGKRSYYVDPVHYYDEHIRPSPDNHSSITGLADNSARWGEYQLPGAEGTYRERLLTSPIQRDARGNITGHEIGGPNFKSNHWDEPNVLVHRRSTDREFPVPQTPEEQAAMARRAEIEPQLEQLRADQADVARTINSTVKPLERARHAQIIDDMKSGKITRQEANQMLEQPFEHPELKPHQERLQQLRAQEDQLRASMPEEIAPKTIRSLHAEEIQSDWHQAGRKQGYGDPQIVREGDRWRAMAGDREIGRGRLEDFPGGDRQIIDNLKGSTVPDAPFKKTWHELAAKDMLREAAEGDYGRISWTAGGSSPTSPKNLGYGTPAEQAAADAGMKGFYDKMMPDYLNKIGKKYGVKVERSTIPDKGGMSGEKAMDRMGIPKEEQGAFWEKLNADDGGAYQRREDFFKQARDKGHEVFHMDVPQAMKDDIKSKGFAMFEDASPGQAAATAGHITESPNFKKWFGKSKVVSDDGRPLQLYHGTTGDFDTFSRDRASIESDWGAGFYFSNKPKDVDANYAGFGPDLTNKIERRIEQMGDDIDPAEARAKVLAELAPHEGATIPVYVKMDKPFKVGGKDESFLDYDGGYNHKTEEYDLPEKGKLVDFVESLRRRAADHDANPDTAIGKIMEEATDGEGITASNLQKILREDEELSYATDPSTGDLSSTEIVRQALQDAGFDGVIDRTVNQKFGSEKRVGKPMVGMDPDTVHYIAFEPTQIKSSTGNSGKFDRKNPSIIKSDTRGAVVPGSLDGREDR